MPRYAFRLRVKPERISDYDEAHRRVWPELLAVLKQAGISDYSIFRRGTELFFYLRADDLEQAWAKVEESSVNARWQQEMSPLFDSPETISLEERFPMMAEVFHLD